MATFKLLLCSLLIIPHIVQATEVNNIPSEDQLRSLVKSYDLYTGKTGVTVAYIPIKRPCLNVVSQGKHKEFCVINEGIDLAKLPDGGSYILLTDVWDSGVSFEYRTYSYASKCSYILSEPKPECEEPYTN